MKKQILTVTMCLAFTATSALAVNTKTTIPTSKTLTSVTKPVNSLPQNTLATPLKKELMTRDEAKKRFEDRKTQERAMMYEALNFTNEQKAKAEALDSKTRAEAGKYLHKVRTEAKKLRDLKAKHASIFAIYKQKFALRTAKNEAHKYFENSRKSFEAILTKEQQAKFKTIQEAKRKEMEQFRKGYKHGAMKKMGPPSEFMGPKGPKHGLSPIVPPPEDKN